jgi:hypothetical protein
VTSPSRLPETGTGKQYRFVIERRRLSYITAVALGKLIQQTEGRGVELLQLETEDGESLWDGPPIHVSAVEFDVLAREYLK